jgi:hypothetical protein
MHVAGLEHRRAVWVAAALGWYALAAGLLSFAGWIFDVRRHRHQGSAELE